MARLQRGCGALLAGLLTSFAAGQEKQDPAPKEQSVPGGFRMLLLADGRFSEEKTAAGVYKDERNRLGKLHDPVTEYGLNSAIAVFVRGLPKDETSPAVALMKLQQQLVERHRAKRLAGFVAFLGMPRDLTADATDNLLAQQIDAVQKIAKGANVPLVSIGLAEATVPAGENAKEGAEKPTAQVAAWGIGPEDAITVVVYHRLKIVKRWKFTADKPPTADDLKDIAAVVDAVMGRKKALGE